MGEGIVKIEDLKLYDLKELLQTLGCEASGNKNALITRLKDIVDSLIGIINTNSRHDFTTNSNHDIKGTLNDSMITVVNKRCKKRITCNTLKLLNKIRSLENRIQTLETYIVKFIKRQTKKRQKCVKSNVNVPGMKQGIGCDNAETALPTKKCHCESVHSSELYEALHVVGTEEFPNAVPSYIYHEDTKNKEFDNTSMKKRGEEIGNINIDGSDMDADKRSQVLNLADSYVLASRNQPRWNVISQRPPYMPQQQVNTTQSSALIAQLTQPPSSMPGAGVNQFGSLGANSPISAQQQQQQQQQQQLRINLITQQQQQQQQSNVQTSLPQNTQNNMQQPPSTSQVTTANQVITSQTQAPTQQNQQLTNPQNIWHGLLKWIEKPKNPNDPQKIAKQVPCHVSTNPSKDGELELKADGWPPELLMQLMPKQLIGNIGGAYLKNSKSVLFHPQNCEALESLTKVMSSGFAGCVHFSNPTSPTPCDIKVLILLYTTEKRAYLGFIPNDQAAFVDRLRKVIQQQKNIQMPRPTGGPNLNPQGGGTVPMSAAPTQMPGTNTSTSQTTQQGLMISQTNAMTMGGGQITQNVVPSSGQGGANMGVLGQSVPGGAMQPRIRMPGMPQAGGQLNQPGAANTNTMASGMLGAPVQRAPFENQLQVERQQNLEKINQLKQTLEAAQQQEQQYKNQLERISHMKTSQLQEALQLAQQTEMQYKILDQQRMANQGNPQSGNVNSQRMMRPVMANNQLRHLLQQQPQYRQQIMGMQQICTGPRPSMGQQMQGGGNNPQVPFDDSSFDMF